MHCLLVVARRDKCTYIQDECGGETIPPVHIAYPLTSTWRRCARVCMYRYKKKAICSPYTRRIGDGINLVRGEDEKQEKETEMMAGPLCLARRARQSNKAWKLEKVSIPSTCIQCYSGIVINKEILHTRCQFSYRQLRPTGPEPQKRKAGGVVMDKWEAIVSTSLA